MKKIFFLAIVAILISNKSFGQFGKNSEEIKKYGAFMNLLTYAYVDSTNNAKLTELAIRKILSSLDPHSAYIPKSEVKKVNEPLVGDFDGVGIEFRIYHDTILVVSPVVGGPSQKLGIKAGDKIIKINDSIVAGVGYTNSDVMHALRGPKGTKVNVAIKRNGFKKLLNFTITRNKIPLYSANIHYMAAPHIGYIKITRMARKTDAEFENSLKALQKQGATSLILDLQDNGGGYLGTAIKLADEFLQSGKTVVFTKGLHEPKHVYKSNGKGLFEKGKLVVLVNQSTASAAEILSGAMQDWDRGLIIGRRTFGKGLVQRPYLLPDSSVVRLTTAHYFTPTGRWIQKPYKHETKQYYYEDILRRIKDGELYNRDSALAHLPDSLKYKTPNGRIVYGGGGIFPDIFVPIDTTHISEFFNRIFRKGIIYDYVLKYVNNNRKKLQKKYADAKSYINNYKISDDLLNGLIKKASEKGIKRDSSDTAITYFNNLLKVYMKALIARNIYNESAFYEIINPAVDNSYKKALKVLESADYKKYKLNF